MIAGAAPEADCEPLEAAIAAAVSAALYGLEADLSKAHLGAVEDRHAELVAFVQDIRTRPLAADTWQFVLAHLTPDMQRVLGLTYRELEDGLGAVLADGEQDQDLETIAEARVVAEELISDLPFTRVERRRSSDDYELRPAALVAGNPVVCTGRPAGVARAGSAGSVARRI